MKGWILPYIQRHKGRMVLSVFLGFLGVFSAAMLLFVSGYLISKSALKPENIMIVYVPIVSVRAFSIGQALFPYLEKLSSHDIVLRILSVYRRRLYTILEPQAVFLESRYKTGDILHVLADDIERLQDFYIKTLLPSIVGLVIYGVLGLVIGFFDWLFMLVMLLVLGIILFLVPIIAYHVMKRQHLAVKKHRGKLYQSMTDAMFGRFDWLVSGRADEALLNIRNENNVLIQKENRIQRMMHVRDGFLRFIAGIAIVLMMFWANMETGEGSISPTIIAAFVLMMFSVTDALLPISGAVEEIPVYKDAIQRIQEMELPKKEDNEKNDGIFEISNHPTIQLEGVTYSYDIESLSVIEQLDLQIPPSEKIAVLGKSGTGKSTLLKLLSGMIQPHSGKAMLDGVEIGSHVLSQQISVLNQKPHLFHTTIANNVRIGKPHATESEIKEVLNQAQILEMIEKLPKGIHTQMDEMGKRFSGGEQQRIAFARVLIQDTPILLCDEPTTGLDPRTERALLKTILEAARQKTIVWVTHHLAGAELMDKVIFLDEGNIKLSGTHTELLKTSDYYKRLFEMDNGGM